MATTSANRAIAATADGAFVLRSGHYWRLLCIVNGPCSCDDIEDALAAVGFDELAATSPQDWSHDQPRDWPKEPLVATAANECPVRVSGALRSRSPIALERDRPLGEGATFTVVAAWDYGEAPAQRLERAGGAGDDKEQQKKDNNVLLAVVLGAAAVGAVSLYRSGRRYERDEDKYASLTAQAEREELGRRVQHYLSRGHTEPEATDLAEREIAAREARKLADQWQQGSE